MRQAEAGRVVMSVDSTNLLYLRHLHGSDEARMQQLCGADEEMDWDTVRVHGEVKPGAGANRIAIVTYGNGVVTSLQVRVRRGIQRGMRTRAVVGARCCGCSGVDVGREFAPPPHLTTPHQHAACRCLQANKVLAEEHGITDAVIIDCPYLSSPPAQLRELLPGFDAVVFADVCKVGQHPFAGFVTQLQNSGELPAAWRCVGAQPTYNPLGQRATFLSTDDITQAVLAVASKA